VGGCWLATLLLYALAEIVNIPLNPVPSVAAAIFGALIWGYVGAGSSYVPAAALIYATLLGLLIALCLDKQLNAAITIGVIVAIHLILSILAFPLLMLIIGH
jgi:hypothetical protein